MSKKTSSKDSVAKDKGANVMFSLDDSSQKTKQVSLAKPVVVIKPVNVKPVAVKPVSVKKAPLVKTQVVKNSIIKNKASEEQSKLVIRNKKHKLKSESKNNFKLQKVESNTRISDAGKTTLVIPHEHESYFVYLKSPLEYRRHLLESSRKILYSLKGYQKIVLIRQKKLEEMRKLRNSVKELIYLNKKFNEMLPKYNIPYVDHHLGNSKQAAPAPVQKVLTPVPARKPVLQREKTEIEKLEDSLANIEKKLRTLQ